MRTKAQPYFDKKGKLVLRRVGLGEYYTPYRDYSIYTHRELAGWILVCAYSQDPNDFGSTSYSDPYRTLAEAKAALEDELRRVSPNPEKARDWAIEELRRKEHHYQMLNVAQHHREPPNPYLAGYETSLKK